MPFKLKLCSFALAHFSLSLSLSLSARARSLSLWYVIYSAVGASTATAGRCHTPGVYHAHHRTGRSVSFQPCLWHLNCGWHIQIGTQTCILLHAFTRIHTHARANHLKLCRSFLLIFQLSFFGMLPFCFCVGLIAGTQKCMQDRSYVRQAGQAPYFPFSMPYATTFRNTQR